ncbi:hypothetical protein VTN96DRAFT_7994 [Rasamsonia emersonii]
MRSPIYTRILHSRLRSSLVPTTTRQLRQTLPSSKKVSPFVYPVHPVKQPFRQSHAMATNPYTPSIMDFDRVWWREVVIYEIYVQSFQDSNNDGIGDLQGIINRLDYLKNLGADMLWLTPIYESPLEDQGYDISNYRAINPLFGTMETWEKMCHEIHKRGMKLMMDMVFNHTSSQVSGICRCFLVGWTTH